MSRWISKHSNYAFGIRTETAEDRRRADGSFERVITRPALIAQFRPIAAATAEDTHADASALDLDVARATWLRNKRRDGSPADIRAIPSLNAAALGSVATVPFNPDTVFGVFDTAWLRDADDEAEADAKLRDPQWGGIGRDYVEVVAPTPDAPWPNYNRLRARKGHTVAETIALKVAEDGYDVAAVLAYEKATKARDEVIDALEALAAADAPADDEQDDAALETVL